MYELFRKVLAAASILASAVAAQAFSRLRRHSEPASRGGERELADRPHLIREAVVVRPARARAPHADRSRIRTARIVRRPGRKRGSARARKSKQLQKPARNRGDIKRAVDAAVLAGLDEREVRRLLEDMGAGWRNTRHERVEACPRTAGAPGELPDGDAATGGPEPQLLRVMELDWPRRRGLRRLFYFGARITIRFDAHGRACKGNIGWPKGL